MIPGTDTLAGILVGLQRQRQELIQWRDAVPPSKLPYPYLIDDALSNIKDASSSIADCLMYNILAQQEDNSEKSF